MKFNSLAFRLFATSAAWTVLVLPLAGIIIYRLYREDVQSTFDARIEKLVNAIAVDSMGAGPDGPIPPYNRYEPSSKKQTRDGIGRSVRSTIPRAQH